MGITAKPCGKFGRLMARLDYKLKKEREALKNAPRKPKKTKKESEEG